MIQETKIKSATVVWERSLMFVRRWISSSVSTVGTIVEINYGFHLMFLGEKTQ